MITLQESAQKVDIPKPLNAWLFYFVPMNKLNALVKVVGPAAIMSLVSSFHANAQTVFISEIHYDNDGGDLNEGFEIFAPAGTDLSCYQIILYNGADGALYNTINLSGTAGDEGCGYDAIWTGLPVNGMQNGGPDGIALYNTCTATLIQFLSYEGSFTATNGPANGVASTNIGVSETGTTPIGQSLQLSGTGTTYGDFSWNAPAAGSTGTINAGMDPCSGCMGPVAEPSTETSGDSATPSCTSAQINWINGNGDNVIVVISAGAITDTPSDGVNYTASATFGSGEELVLSDGQFVVYNGSGTSTTVSGLTPGTTYNYAIFGYDGAQIDCEENYLTGGNFGSFVTETVCDQAQITTIMVNSCNGIAEGTDELIIIENGSEPINIDDMTITLPNTEWCNSGCGGNTIGNNATYLADLNTMAGCSPDLFVYADPIPAGATIIIFTGDPPSSVLDYSSNCGAPGAPMYVLFLNNTSITGNYANSGSVPKETTIDFGNGQSDVVTYLPDDVDQNDGGSVLFDDAGNPSYYTSTDCVYPLALRLSYLYAEWQNDFVEITWSGYSQPEAEVFYVQRSTDGFTFETIGTVQMTFLSDAEIPYSFTDMNPAQNPLVYYRIAQIETTGSISYSGIVSVMSQQLWVNYSDRSIQLVQTNTDYKVTTVNIYSLNGSLVFSDSFTDNLIIPFSPKGVYILEIPELNYRQKLVCL